MTFVIYFRYSALKLRGIAKANELQKKLDQEIAAHKEFEYKYSKIAAVDAEKVEALFREIDELRKEKESEVRLRLAAERQTDLALQKTIEVEKRMEDWHAMQDAAMRDSKDVIIKIGNDLYRKLTETYKNEIEINRTVAAKVSQIFDKISGDNSAESNAQVQVAVGQKTAASKRAETASKGASLQSEPVKKIVGEFVEIMKASGHLSNQNYFLPANFDGQKSKLLLCEVAFLSGMKLHALDFKACEYIADFNTNKEKNLAGARKILQKKMEDYFTYLSEAKYRDSIEKVMAASQVACESIEVAAVVSKKADIQILKELNLAAKADSLGLQLIDFDLATNIVL
jgi:hypothetical protein